MAKRPTPHAHVSATGVGPMVTWPPYSLALPFPTAGDLPADLDPALFVGLPVLARPALRAGATNPDDIETIYLWPVNLVLRQLWHTAAGLLLQEKHIVPAPEEPTDAEAAAWVTQTRALATRWPARARQLLTTAEAIERPYALRACFRRAAWPTTAARRRQLRTSLAFWAIRELRASALTIAPLRAPTMAQYAAEAFRPGPKITAAQQRLLDAALAEDSLDWRVRGMADRIRPGAEADLMAWCLHDTLTIAECGRVAIPAPRG